MDCHCENWGCQSLSQSVSVCFIKNMFFCILKRILLHIKTHACVCLCFVKIYILQFLSFLAVIDTMTAQKIGDNDNNTLFSGYMVRCQPSGLVVGPPESLSSLPALFSKYLLHLGFFQILFYTSFK